MGTSNYNFTYMDDADNIDVVGDVNQRLDEIDAVMAPLNSLVFHVPADREVTPINIDVGSFAVNRGFQVGTNMVTMSARTLHEPIENEFITGLLYSEKLKRPLPQPSDYVAADISGDLYGMYGYQRHLTDNGCSIEYRLVALTEVDADEGYNVYEHIHSIRKKPPALPHQSAPYQYGTQVVACARSYYQARINGRKFGYGANWTYRSSNLVNNASGVAMGECDTLAFLAVSRVPYIDSPYANETAGATYAFADFDPPNTELLEIEGLNGSRGTYTSSQSWYCNAKGYTFTDKDSVRDGDLVFFRAGSDYKNDDRNFDGITHVAIAYRNPDDDYKIWLYHWTSLTDTHVDFISLDDYIETHPFAKYDTEGTAIYFARLKNA